MSRAHGVGLRVGDQGVGQGPHDAPEVVREERFHARSPPFGIVEGRRSAAVGAPACLSVVRPGLPALDGLGEGRPYLVPEATDLREQSAGLIQGRQVYGA